MFQVLFLCDGCLYAYASLRDVFNCIDNSGWLIIIQEVLTLSEERGIVSKRTAKRNGRSILKWKEEYRSILHPLVSRLLKQQDIKFSLLVCLCMSVCV